MRARSRTISPEAIVLLRVLRSWRECKNPEYSRDLVFS